MVIDAMEASDAIFTLPRPDGSFEPEHAAYLQGLGRRRQSVMLAFAPKAAGTFLRAAAIGAVDGQLARVVHAQGGRDGTPYLPTYVRYFLGGFPHDILVTHLHMQAFPANRAFIEALDLKPVIMLRSVPDMLLSYIDMLDTEGVSPAHWINAAIPVRFVDWDFSRRADFMIDVIVPWYASYFATWLDYHRQAPKRVCVLRFDDLVEDPASVLEVLLAHSRIVRPYKACELATNTAWQERNENRFNKGEQGRGITMLSTAQKRRIERLLFETYDLEEWSAELLPER